MDGISEAKFDRIYNASTSRRDFVSRYMRNFMKSSKPDAQRWFDKSPQNIYGLALIAQDFPRAKFIHIVRNPGDVVSSLKTANARSQGRVIGSSVLEACNYWNEAVGIIAAMKPALGARLFEIRYEEFCADYQKALRRIFEFLEESALNLDERPIREKSYANHPVLTTDELAQVQEHCSLRARRYGY